MPELPEVEGFRLRLAPLISGRRLARLDVLDEKLWRPAVGLDPRAVGGSSVLSLERRAKLLLFHLEGAPHGSRLGGGPRDVPSGDAPPGPGGELVLALHLKIAGQLVFATPDGHRAVGGHPYPLPDVALPAPSTRFVLDFGPRGTLYVNDQRRFAWLRLMPLADLPGFLDEQRYGPDPLDPGFTAEVFAARLQARRGRPIKAALLDQTCVAGLGNIYSDESLHGAGLHPMRRTGSLTGADTARLHGAIRSVLARAVPVGGAVVRRPRGVAEGRSAPSAETFPEATAAGAGERDFLRAHGRAGSACPDCAAAGRVTTAGEPPTIVRQLLAGRGTYFCPTCQPAPQTYTSA
jgi:formamidopyrimidine-DNA glycosylase